MIKQLKNNRRTQIGGTLRLCTISLLLLSWSLFHTSLVTSSSSHASTTTIADKIHTVNKSYGSHDSVKISRRNSQTTSSSILIRGGSTLLTRKNRSTLSNKKNQAFLKKNKQIDRRTKTSFSNNNNNNAIVTPPLRRSDLVVFQSSSFFLVLSLALVTFSPAPALIAKIGSERATSILSVISACAALMEIVFSPALGSLLDSVGRKPALLFTLISIATVHGAVSIHSSVLTICAAKFISAVSVGLFFISSQVIISDISASNPEKLGSMLGVQSALIGAAFFLGAIGAGRLSEFGLSVIYGTSTIIAVLTAALVSVGMRETLLPSKRIPFQDNKVVLQQKLLQSPWSSCTRILFRHSKKVRVLALLIMVQSLPAFMGDTFQILVKTEWGLNTKDFSSFVAMFGIINIAANVVGSQLVVKLGIKHFTAISTLSVLLAPIGASFFSFRGLIIGSIVGFLGSAQMLGVTAALYAEGMKSDVSQGELAGERSSFIALAKVIAPIWYSLLYVKGKKFLGTGNLPFLFNIVCGLSAFGISQSYLSSKSS